MANTDDKSEIWTAFNKLETAARTALRRAGAPDGDAGDVLDALQQLRAAISGDDPGAPEYIADNDRTVCPRCAHDEAIDLGRVGARRFLRCRACHSVRVPGGRGYGR